MLHGTSTLYGPKIQFIDVFVRLLSFTLPVELFLWLFSSCFNENFLFHYLCLLFSIFWKFSDCLNACDISHVRHILWTNHYIIYNRLLKIGMIWWGKKTFSNKQNYLYNKIILSYFMCLGRLSVEHYVKIIRWIGSKLEMWPKALFFNPPPFPLPSA